MSYGLFMNKVNHLLRKCGGGISAQFETSDGRFLAKCSDGTTIEGNGISRKVLIRWGSGHQALATI